MIYQRQRVLPCSDDGHLEPEIDTLDGAVNSEKDAPGRHEVDG